MDSFHNKKEVIVKNKNTLPYPSRTLDPPISILDQAGEIEKAHDGIKNKVNHKLDVILKQIRNLQDEAKSIISDANEDIRLHNVPCKFKKIPGQSVYLYENDEQNLYFSKLSPEEWGGSPPHLFVGGYRIDIDNGFKKIDS